MREGVIAGRSSSWRQGAWSSPKVLASHSSRIRNFGPLNKPVLCSTTVHSQCSTSASVKDNNFGSQKYNSDVSKHQFCTAIILGSFFLITERFLFMIDDYYPLIYFDLLNLLKSSLPSPWLIPLWVVNTRIQMKNYSQVSSIFYPRSS